MAPTPKYVLIAGNEEDKNMVAKLTATLEEEQKARKASDEEKEKVEAKLKAIDEEDKVEHAKKAIKAALDDIKDEDKKTEATKAMTDIFETGNGVNTNAVEDEEKKEQTAVIASLTADAGKPLIAGILTAKKYFGADEKSLKASKEQLEKLDYPALKAKYADDEVYIKTALKASHIVQDGNAAVALMEAELPFNGTQDFALTGKAIDLDEVRNL